MEVDFEREPISSQSPHIDAIPSGRSSPVLLENEPSQQDLSPKETEKNCEDDNKTMEEKVMALRARYQFRQSTITKLNNQQIPSDIPEEDLKGILGIANLGNTCYANSTLQILRACGTWSTYVLSETFIDDGRKETKILLGYKDLLKSLWSASRPGFVRPFGWMNMIRECVQGTVWDMFAMPIQNDAHEFLVYLLDMFHEALKIKNNDTSTLDIKLTRNSWQNFMNSNNSKVADLFFGLIKKTVRCGNCGKFSDSFEPFNVLKVDCLDSDKPFQEWLKTCFRVEELDDYACEGCTPLRTKATIHLTLCRVPKNLFVCIKRFNPNGRKIMNTVTNASDIDLNPFFEPYCAGVNNSGFDSIYKLKGIIDHHGSHMGGHYTSQFCSPLNGRWWWMDDESTMYLPEPRFGASNYMYLYRVDE